jgi:uncharacterized peroxidase-related enzyme
MPRIASPSGIADALPAVRPFLQEAQDRVGRVPNLLKMLANSPAALTGYRALRSALAESSLSAATRRRITLAVTEVNGCDYCRSANIYFGRQSDLDDAELTANRNGASNDMQADAAVRLAAKITRERGHVTDADVAAFKAAGYSDGELIELVLQVSLTTMTNYLNEVAGTEIDFPLIPTRISKRTA